MNTILKVALLTVALSATNVSARLTSYNDGCSDYTVKLYLIDLHATGHDVGIKRCTSNSRSIKRQRKVIMSRYPAFIGRTNEFVRAFGTKLRNVGITVKYK